MRSLSKSHRAPRKTTRTAELVIAAAASAVFVATSVTARELTFEDRVNAQAAIERVYASHRIWPAQNGGPPPALSRLLPESALRAKVDGYLRKSKALDEIYRRPVTAADLQRELDRIVVETRAPKVLLEIFDALGNDPFLIAETLARPLVVDRRIRNAYAHDARLHGARRKTAEASFDAWWASEKRRHVPSIRGSEASYALRHPSASGCVPDTWSRIESEVPGPRGGHSAVWTGTEMIVWGGTDGLYRDTGSRYDPATSTWTPIARGAGAPSSRVYHSAIWTGSEMIVWGGADQRNTPFQDGGRYDPASDTWRPTSTGTGCPVPRGAHTAVWTGTRMIVWGGAHRAGNTGGVYDPSTDRWTPMSAGATAPTERYHHTAVWTGTEMILWGGYDYAGNPLDTGGRYSPGTDTWAPSSRGANLPVARAGHEAVWTGSEMIVWGGQARYAPVNSGGRYNPTTDTWAATSVGANVPGPRTEATAVWTGSEMIVWGGSGGGNDGARYDPAADAWTPTSLGAGVPIGRSWHTAVWTGTEMIVWGGNGGSSSLSSGGRYDPVTDSWRSTAGDPVAPGARHSHAAVWTGAEMIVWGGNGGEGSVLNTGGRYDPSTNSWTPTSLGAHVPSARYSPSAVWTGTQMIIWGGHDFHDAVNSGGRYSPLTDTWAPTSTGANVPQQRMDYTAVWTGTEMIVWGGGNSYSGFRNDGGRYDPVRDAWATVSTGPGVPSGRSEHSAVWAGSEMIVWGGIDLGGSMDTGARYAPASDTWRATLRGVGTPSPRSGHLAVWTGADMIVWGGSGLNTGGRYRPSTNRWFETPTTPPAPEPRERPTAVWTGDEMIVWGGRINGLPVNTGGRFDPDANAWTATSSGPDVPSARFLHTAVWTGLEMIVWGPDGAGDRYCVVNCLSPERPSDDRDGDGLHNACDDCPDASDSDQTDFDGDGTGDACENGAVAADADLSRRVDGFDLAILGRAFGSFEGDPAYQRRADLNRDGRVDGDDLAIMAAAWAAIVPAVS